MELALKLSDGHLIVLANKDELFFSEKNYCAKSNKNYPDLGPRLFSFNSPLGACPQCNGIGNLKQFTESSLITSPQDSLLEGACPILQRNSFLLNMIKSIAKAEKVKLENPFKSLPKPFKNTLFNGSGKKTILLFF